jgi:hypothetical protein
MDWHCYKCNFKIFGKKNSCLKCGTTKKEALEESKQNSIKDNIKYDDWYCSNCDFKIFGKKDSCSKCGKTKKEALEESK